MKVCVFVACRGPHGTTGDGDIEFAELGDDGVAFGLGQQPGQAQLARMGLGRDDVETGQPEMIQAAPRECHQGRVGWRTETRPRGGYQSCCFLLMR
jgi:hypothetical protein